MSVYSKFLSLINGTSRTVDLSTNTLSTQGLQLNAATGGGAITQLAHASTSSYTISWPAAQAASSGYVLSNDGTGNLSWISGSSGSVTSVAFADDSTVPIFSVSGSPVTSTGTLAITLNTQSANYVFAGPASGSAAQPGFRSLVSADIPNNAANTTGTASNITATSNSTLTTLSALTAASNLSSIGTITSGTWNGTVIGYAYGGTNASSQAQAQINMSPMTTAGDLTYENSTPAPARLPIGTNGQILTVVSGLPAWAAAPSTGVTSVAFADASTTPIYTISGSPVTSTGTLTQTLNTQSAHAVFVGPASGSAAQPTFRALVSSDIPSLSSIYLPLSGGTMSGAINMGNNQINALATPTSSTDAATKGYVDSAISGLTWKGPVQAYANSNVPLTGSTPLVIDGYTVANGDLLLLGNQTTASQNGEYSAAISGGTYTLTANGLPNAIGDAWLVLNGTTYKDSAFVATAVVPSATFTEFAGPTAYTFSSPLTLSGNTVSITQATTSTNGYLSSTDWNTFNNKQPAGNYITALTGDATASGPGSAALTLATVNTNVGTFGSSTSIPSFTVNAKGLITAASGNAVIAPAGTLSGTTLNSTVVSSSLTSVGTIGTGVWQGTAIGPVYGGTGLSSYATGDTLYASASNTLSRLGIGSTGNVLTVVGGIPSWQPPATSGTVTSVSVVTANGFAGTVATATSTPAITISTTITGVLQGNGTAISAASTTGSGNVVLSANPTLTGTVNAASVALSGSLTTPAITFSGIAGQTFGTTNSTYAVRWGITANSETANRLYACDISTTSYDLFYCIGTVSIGASSVSAGSTIVVTRLGGITLGSSDPSFSLVGQPVYLASGGVLTQTAPTSSGQAITRIGILSSTTTVDVNPATVGVN